ncbi:MAG: hypothetical protein IT561_18995 [Alphaproteobacteria bacterium]|nr:hypothetical protein [Alphaproteobacteria bacterium]
MSEQQPTGKVGWRVNEWCAAVGIRRTTAHHLMVRQEITTVRLGRARIITTPPAAFLASLAPAKSKAA